MKTGSKASRANTKRTEYFKVLSGDETRMSCIIKNLDARVYYPVGKWVRPKIKGSKLLVFDNEINAVQFRRNRHRKELIIVKCHCLHPVKVDVPLIIYSLHDHTTILKELWELYQQTDNRSPNFKKRLRIRNCQMPQPSELPKGTVLVSAVKCLE